MRHAYALVSLLAAALAGAGGAGAAVFTVGPGGTHATIGAALAAAIAAGGSNEVRVATGTYAENIDLGDSFASGSLTLTGGWNAAFTARVTDAGATVVDGRSGGFCLKASPPGGTMVLEGLTFTHTGTGTAGGVKLVLSGASVAEVRNCRLVGNTVSLAGGANGGGLKADTSGTAQLTVRDSVFVDNHLVSSGSTTAGAGLSLYAEADAQLVVEHNVVADNTGSATTNQTTGVGIRLNLYGNARATIADNLVARNLAIIVPGHGVVGAAAALWINETSQLSAVRNSFLGNGEATGVSTQQLSLITSDTATLTLSDSLVAAGSGAGASGIGADQRDGSTLRITNCTIADNPSTGVYGSVANGTVTIANCIVTGNGNDTGLAAGVAVTGTLVGGDPLFVDRAHWDYRLRAGSPAIDAGSDSPPGGLGPSDLAGAARTSGAHADQGAFEYVESASRFPVVTHAAGFGGTPWRSSVVATNLAQGLASLELTFTEAGTPTTIASTVPAGGAAAFPDVVVSPLGFPSSAQHSGSLVVVADSPGVALSSRTFADPGGGAGTYGQFIPAVGDDEMLASGETAFIPLARSDAGFYTNVGMVNGSGASCTGRVRLFDAGGMQVGSTRTVTAGPSEWRQISDAFAAAGAGSHSAAYAVVDVTTTGGAAWFYGSVIDRTTKDPTTVPMQRAVPAGTVLRVPAAAHVAGAGGTPWRTSLSVVNAGSGAATVTLTYRSGATTVVRTASIPAGAVTTWDDLLVGLFGYGAGASTSGAVELWADQPLAVAGRSYADRGAAGTYGQFLPALAAGRDGTGSLVAGVLTQLRKDGSFYTNVGFQNLAGRPCDVRVTVVDLNGTRLGSAVTRTVAAAQWLQINDVFAAAGAGGAATAYAIVEVLTPGGRLWSYASVIDALSRDPTTVPLARPWVIGPKLM